MSLYRKTLDYGATTDCDNIIDNTTTSTNTTINNNMDNEDTNETNDEVKVKASFLMLFFKDMTAQDYTIIANTTNTLLGVSIFAIPWYHH